MEESVEIFKALGDKTRLQILDSLRLGQKCGSEIALELGWSQPHIAHHMGILKSAKIVVPERQGHKMMYALNRAFWSAENNGMEIGSWVLSLQFPEVEVVKKELVNAEA